MCCFTVVCVRVYRLTRCAKQETRVQSVDKRADDNF